MAHSWGILGQTKVPPLGGANSGSCPTHPHLHRAFQGSFRGLFMQLSSLFEALISLLGGSFLSTFNTDLGISWKKELHLRNCLLWLGLWACLWSIFFIGD